MTHPAGPHPQSRYGHPQSWYGHPQQPHHLAPPPGQRAAAPPPGPPGVVPPPPGWGASAAPPPVVIDVGKTHARRVVIAMVISFGLGIPVLALGAVEVSRGDVGGGVAAVVFGGLLVLLGLVPAFRRKRDFRPRRLLVAPTGIQWDDPNGQPWSVAWGEVAAVAFCRLDTPEMYTSVTEYAAGKIVDKSLGKHVPCYIDMFPADAGFHHRHPEMAPLWTGDRLRLLLGSDPRLLPQLDAALQRFQPHRYLGVKQITRKDLKRR